MKRQKSSTFAKTNLNINTLMITIIIEDHCHYTGKHRGAAHSQRNSKYSKPKKFTSFSQWIKL